MIVIDDGCDDWDARLLYEANTWVVATNPRKPQIRQMFGIAHELAHREIILNCQTMPEGEYLESLCDQGAHELLFSDE